MRTPAGTQCRYYYEDYHRGREIQECRLIAASMRSLPWEPKMCSRCPVPAILNANRCPNMRLRARIVRRWLRRRVEVTATCEERQVEVENPYVGCGYCHPAAAAVLAPQEGKEK